MAQGHAGLFTSGCYAALTEEQIQGPITFHYFFFLYFIQFRAGGDALDSMPSSPLSLFLHFSGFY